MKKGISQNLSMAVLTAVLIHVFLTDCVIYFAAVEYIAANAVVAVVEVILYISLLKKKIVRITSGCCRWDIFFWMILAVVCVMSIGFADENWDTYSYHIYLQENPFTDKIFEDYFPGRTLTSFVYPLVDRVFYLFRSVFGYRLGTLPSYLILIPMYYGVKKLLRFLVPAMEQKFLSVISIVPLCTFIILQQMGTYYIDNFSIVLLLEFTYVTMANGKNFIENRAQLYFLALLAGIATCIKFTNAIFLIGLIIYLLIKNIRKLYALKWFDYILAVVFFLVPLLAYGMDAIRQTGNPFFPYYNKIFRSAYFAEENWLDLRFGPNNLWQFLVWPVYILFHPDKAYDLKHGLTDFAFAAGYVLSLIYFLKGLYARYRKTESYDKGKWFLSGILLYDYLVWEKFIIGYTRYAGIIPVLGMIFVIWLLWEGIVERNKCRKIVCIAVVSVSVFVGGIEYCGYCAPRYYACYFIPAIAEKFREENPALKIRQAFAMLGKDRDNLSYDIDGIWGVVRDDSLSPQLLSTDDRIVYLEYGFKTGETEKAQQIYWDNVLNNNIYVPLFGSMTEEKLKILDENHFELSEVTDILYDVPFIQGEQTMYIVRVQYNAEHSGGNTEIFENLKTDENTKRNMLGFETYCSTYEGAAGKSEIIFTIDKIKKENA
ncbi:MAG: hypothetical protein HDR13_04410 [Lachnospiraceae bacterium]|nr:hypothetical protein [Lachnospiraceae bacterium]